MMKSGHIGAALMENHMTFEKDNSKTNAHQTEFQPTPSKRTYTDISGLHANRQNFNDFRKEAQAKEAAKEYTFDKPKPEISLLG